MMPDTAVAIPVEALDRFMPLHLHLDGEGRIVGIGPTLAKLLAGQDLIGRFLFESFVFRRPSGLANVADLRAHAGEKLRLSLHTAARTVAFRGLAMDLAGGSGLIVNLSLGIGVVEAVRGYCLTEADFAPTDLTVEMLYLVEAETAAMGALRGLAQRLRVDKQMAEAQAMTDTLTGLPNRRALSMALDGLTRARLPYSLMHIDLDFFKAVNDTFGHAAGDHVLQIVATVLGAETRHEDTVARVGGDEFVLAFPGMTGTAQLEAIARRIIAQLTQPIDFEGQVCRISASIGITISTEYEEPMPDRMQQDADKALYASKRAGRGRAQVFRPDKGDRRRP